MTLLEFRKMGENEQVAALYASGVYVGKRKLGGRILLLYQLDSFYVEIIYRKYRCIIEQMRCSDSTRLVDPYLEQINVFYKMQ